MTSASRLVEDSRERAFGQRQLECIFAGRFGAGEQSLGYRPGAARKLDLGSGDAPRLVGDTAECNASGPIAVHDGADRYQREGVGSAVAHLAVDMRAAKR